MSENNCQGCHTLKGRCDEAFAKHPNSCSHAVWHVIKGYLPTQPYLTANALVTTLFTDPRWQEVQVFEVGRLANEGVLVVGGIIEHNHGHVIVVYPGPPKSSGGYYYADRKTGKKEEARSLGVYPLVMSTSMGTWPGARSNGDKTIIDPWPNSFRRVRFWKYVGN